MGTTAAESPKSMNEGTSTSNQVEDNLEEETGMEIDLPQGFWGINLMGQFEGQLGDVEEQVKISQDVSLLSDYVVLPIEDNIQSTCQNDDSTYNHMFQGAVSYFYKKKDSFQHIVVHGREEAHEIASKLESLASAMRNLIKRGNTRPASTNNDNQIRTTEAVTEQSMQATEPTTQDEFLEQEMAQQMEDCSMEEVDGFINLGGAESN